MAQILLTACDPHQDQGVTVPGVAVHLADSQGRLVLVDLCDDDPAREAVTAVQQLADKYGRNLDGTPVRRTGRPRSAPSTAAQLAPASDGDGKPPAVQCKVCDRTFSHRRERDNHMRDDHATDPNASDPRAEQCPFCRWKWVNLGTHVRSAHPGEHAAWHAARRAQDGGQLALDKTA